MKAICSKKNLQEACILGEKITGNNPSFPILNAFLISSEKNKIKISSTNLEVSLEFSIPAQIKKEGKIALPAKLFSGLVSSLVDDKIKIDSLNNNLVLSTNNTSTTIKGYNVEDFPILPKTKEKKVFVISSEDFVSGLKSVYYSVSLSEMKPELNSVFIFSSKGDPLTFVATDSFRLSEKTFINVFPGSFAFMVPYRSVIEMIRVYENRREDLKIILDDNSLMLKNNNLIFTSRLVEGNFVDYKQIIPNKFFSKVVIKKKELVNILKTTALFCSKLNEVKMKIYENESFIEFQSVNPDMGEHVAKVYGKTEGGDISMSFNHRYLTDCLSSLNSENVLFRFAGEGKPLFVSSLEDNSFRYLVMPMRNV